MRSCLAYLWILLAMSGGAQAQTVVADDYLTAIADRELRISLEMLIGNDLLSSSFEGLEIVQTPVWGHLAEDTSGAKSFLRYEISTEEILPSLTWVDRFSYRLRSGTAFSEEAFVFVKIYPDRTPIAGRWANIDPHSATWSGLGWYDAESLTFCLCSIYSRAPEDDYLAACRSYELPVDVPRGGEPLVGDWDGDGFDDLGMYDPWSATFYLYVLECSYCERLTLHAQFSWGVGGDLPVAGDWDGRGRDRVGLYDPVRGGFSLLDTNSAHSSFAWIPFSPRGRPVVGQWNAVTGGLADTVGVFDRVSQTFHYRLGETEETEPLHAWPALGLPFSLPWGGYSWIGARDPEEKVILLFAHPDTLGKTRRVSVPKDPERDPRNAHAAREFAHGVSVVPYDEFRE